MNRRTKRRGQTRGSRTGPLTGGFDGTTISTRSITSDLTAASNILSGSITIDCTAGTTAMGTGGTGIANNYQKYRYQDLEVVWNPKVAPGTTAAGARVYVAYIDNPEMMVAWLSGSNATNLTRIKTFATLRIFNAWERFKYKVPLTRRRPWFDMNATNDTTVDVLDRSTQGLFIFAADTPGATDNIGSFSTAARVTLQGWQAAISS